MARFVTSAQIWLYQNRQVEQSESPALGHLENVGGSDAARRLFELRNARASQPIRDHSESLQSRQSRGFSAKC